MNLIERITALEVELADLRKQVTEEKVWPQDGDRYWTVAIYGDIEDYGWYDDNSDKGALAIGNVFKTREEAQAEADARHVIAELRRQPEAKPFQPGKPNWCIKLCPTLVEIGTAVFGEFSYCFVHVYFSTEDQVKAAIEAVGRDRILRAARWLAMREVAE